LLLQQVDGGLCLLHSEGRGDLFEGAVAFPLPKKVKATGADSMVDQQPRESLIR
jgi:hypothetical protein